MSTDFRTALEHNIAAAVERGIVSPGKAWELEHLLTLGLTPYLHSIHDVYAREFGMLISTLEAARQEIDDTRRRVEHEDAPLPQQ